MPLYMDIHSLDGAVTFEDVGKAHQADLQTQGGYDVSYLRYWVDGKHGKIFCLVEAPTADAATTVHRVAHGLVAERSTKCRRGHETAPKNRCRQRRCRRPVCGSSGDCGRLRRARRRSVFDCSARPSTAKYHSLTVAKKAGYSILADTAGITCIAEPGMGANGVHYVKGDLVNDPAIDAKEPEALVYAPDGHGTLHLAALEYVVIQGDWNAHQSRQQVCQSRPTRTLRRRSSWGTSSTSPTRPTDTVSRRSTRCTSGSGRTTLPGPSRCGTPT